MIDIKVSLSIELPGSTMLSKEECLKTTRKVWKDNNGKVHSKKKVEEDWDKMESHSFWSAEDKKKGIKSELLTYHTRKCISARQNINICAEAYNYMIDANSCPEWSKAFIWKKLSKNQRLSAHMDKIAESFGGKVIGFHIFED